MHIFSTAILVALCVIISAPVHADEFVSLVEHNFPYEEVDASYGTAEIQDGRCSKGVPFSVSQKRFSTNDEMVLAKQVHEKLRRLGANGFMIIDLTEGTLVTSIEVVPLTCALG